jgi:hypothetical protein
VSSRLIQTDLLLRIPSMRRNRPSLADQIRSLNRFPFVLALLVLTTAAFGVATLVLGGWSWGYALMTLWSLALGIGLLVLYYRFREV